jgi:hypothetical protein
MSEVKTVVLGDFSKREFDYLNALIADHLADMDINPASFAFHLEVDYTEETDNERAG